MNPDLLGVGVLLNFPMRDIPIKRRIQAVMLLIPAKCRIDRVAIIFIRYGFYDDIMDKLVLFLVLLETKKLREKDV